MTSIALPARQILTPRFEFPAWVKKIGDPLKMLAPLGGALTPLGVSAVIVTPSTLLDSLVAYWLMGEAAGATRDDSIGASDLTDHNTVGQIAGQYTPKAALTNRAANRYLSVSDNAALSMGGSQQFTIIVWVYATSWTGGGDGLIGKWAGASNYEYLLYQYGGKFYFSISTTGGAGGIKEASTSANTAVAKKWTRLACGFDGTNVWISINNGTASTTAAGGSAYNGTAELQVGTYATTEILNGRIYRAGIWKRTLTTDELAEEYAGGVGKPYPFVAASVNRLNWARCAGSPVFSVGANTWNDLLCYRPWICKNVDGTPYQDGSSRYLCYYGASGSAAGLDNDQIGLMRSTDLVAWTEYGTAPVVAFGGVGTWDYGDTHLGSVIYDSGTFHMWYGGSPNRPSPAAEKIGYASSSDGLSWTKDGSNPILTVGAGGTDDATELYQPVVIKDGSTWKMWYTGRNAANKYRLMYATASNPQGAWTKYSTSYIYDPGYDLFVSDVWKDGSTYHMLYYNIDALPYQTYHMTSSDGITWSGAAIIFSTDESSAWDDERIQDTCSFPVGSNYYVMYSGSSSGTFKIGLATNER